MPAKPGSLRVASWNIERGYHPDEICHLLASLEADLYLLTELDRGNLRTAKVDMFERLEQSLGMSGAFAQEFEEHPSLWRRLIPQGGPGGGVHGNAVFCRWPLKSLREQPLPVNDTLSWTGTTIVPELFEPRSGRRLAQAFELDWQGQSVTVINTHLENWRCDWSLRRAQLQAALSLRTEGPCIIAGDMNPLGGVLSTLWPRRAVNWEVRALRQFLRDEGLEDPFPDKAATIFSWGVQAKFDWLALSQEFQVLERQNLRTRWSDHNCLVVDVSLAAGRSSASCLSSSS